MYRVRVRSTKKPAPVHGVLLIMMLVFGVFITTRHSHPHPHIKSSVSAPAIRFVPGMPPRPRPVPSRLPFPIGESSGVLWNLTTHQLMWQLHPNLEGGFASTTKLMTFYLIYHRLSLSQVVTITPQAAATTGSDIAMHVGQRFTVRQLLYALLMASANDAAVALADTASHSTSAFVRLMNQTAQSFGMYHTHYQDPDGLSPGSYGSAWDLAVIAEQDLKIPLFRKIVDTKQVRLPGNPTVTNLNGLLYMDPSVIGVKTGWTTKAGFNVVFEARRKVHGKPVTLLGILMHGQYGFPPVDSDAENLLNWGFSQLQRSKPLAKTSS